MLRLSYASTTRALSGEAQFYEVRLGRSIVRASAPDAESVGLHQASWPVGPRRFWAQAHQFIARATLLALALDRGRAVVDRCS